MAATAEDVVLTVIYTAMITMIVLGNTLVLVAFIKHRSLRTTTNIFLMNVAVADILTGLTSALLTVVLRVVPGASSNYMLCMVDVDAVLFTVGASNIFVVLANLERYAAIHWPFRYDKLVRRRNLVAIIVFFWVFFFSIGLCPLLGWNDFRPDGDCDFITVMSLGLCFIVVIIYMSMFLMLLMLNVRIFKTARRQATRIAHARGQIKMPRLTGDLVSTTNSGLYVDEYSTASATSGVSTRTFRKLSRANIKAARVVAIVVGIYGMCHFPTACLMAQQLRLRVQGEDPHSLYKVFSYLLMFTFLNSVMNPLIYYMAMPGFRDAFKMILCSWKKRAERRSSNHQLYD